MATSDRDQSTSPPATQSRVSRCWGPPSHFNDTDVYKQGVKALCLSKGTLARAQHDDTYHGVRPLQRGGDGFGNDRGQRLQLRRDIGHVVHCTANERITGEGRDDEVDGPSAAERVQQQETLPKKRSAVASPACQHALKRPCDSGRECRGTWGRGALETGTRTGLGIEKLPSRWGFWAHTATARASRSVGTKRNIGWACPLWGPEVGRMQARE